MCGTDEAFGRFKLLPFNVLEHRAGGRIVPEDGGADDGHRGFEVAAGADPDGADDAGVGVDLGIAVDPCGSGEAAGALDGGRWSGPVGDEAIDELGDFRVVGAIEDFAVDAGDVAFFAWDLAAERSPAGG